MVGRHDRVAVCGAEDTASSTAVAFSNSCYLREMGTLEMKMDRMISFEFHCKWKSLLWDLMFAGWHAVSPMIRGSNMVVPRVGLALRLVEVLSVGSPLDSIVVPDKPSLL
jgi:hypothetical protein